MNLHLPETDLPAPAFTGKRGASELLNRVVGFARHDARKNGHDLVRFIYSVRHVGGMAHSYCKRCGKSIVCTGSAKKGKRISGGVWKTPCSGSRVGRGTGDG